MHSKVQGCIVIPKRPRVTDYRQIVNRNITHNFLIGSAAFLFNGCLLTSYKYDCLETTDEHFGHFPTGHFGYLI